MYSGNQNAIKSGIKRHGSYEKLLSLRYSNQRVNDALKLFYQLSDDRDYVGERLIPRRIKPKEIDYLLNIGCSFDKSHIKALIKAIDIAWCERKIQDMR